MKAAFRFPPTRGSNKENMDRFYYVYIMTNKPNGVLYTGVTNDLCRRVYEHKHGLIPGFTSKYNLKALVYYEQHQEIAQAILREKRIKKWNREWKINLIKSINAAWQDLSDKII